MSKTQPNGNEGIAHDRTLDAITTPRLGIDNEGAAHYYDEAADEIVVVDADGKLLTTVALEGRSTDAYKEFIAEEKGGWAVTGIAQLADGVARVGGLH